MTVANATHGEVRFRGAKVAKVRSINMETQRQTLETTGIGDLDDTYAYGKRSHAGSGTLLYKTDDQATRDLMNRILDNGETPDELTMILYKGSTSGTITGSVLINSQGIASSVGDQVQVNISFVISGKPGGTY
jgi:hypothetical protein